MKSKIKKQRQDEQRRMNQAYRELAHAGGYIDRAVKLVSLQYLVGSMVDVIGAELEQTLCSSGPPAGTPGCRRSSLRYPHPRTVPGT